MELQKELENDWGRDWVTFINVWFCVDVVSNLALYEVAIMTEKDIYSNGVALLEEWEDVNYCEHSFKFKDEWLTDKEVVDLLNDLNNEKESWRKSWIEELNDSEEQSKCILKLVNENEELKKEIQNLQAKLNILEQAITGDKKQ